MYSPNNSFLTKGGRVVCLCAHLNKVGLQTGLGFNKAVNQNVPIWLGPNSV